MAADRWTRTRFVCLTLTLQLLAASVEISARPGYVGCYKATEETLAMVVASGYSQATEQSCKEDCALFEYSYAGLLDGRHCFCSDTLPDSGHDPDCSVPCTDDPGTYCGGDESLGYFHTPEPIASLNFTRYGTGVMKTQENETFSLNNVSSVTIQLDYGDGAGKMSMNDSRTFTRGFAIPGDYTVFVYGNSPVNAEVPEVSSSVGVTVDQPVSDGVLVCPPTHLINVEMCCTLTIPRGTNLIMSVDWGEDNSTETYELTGPLITGEQFAIPYHGPLDPNYGNAPTSSQLDKPYLHFSKTGTIIGLEYYAATTGQTKIKIFKPDCSGQQFCHHECKATGCDENKYGCPASQFLYLCEKDQTCTNDAAISNCSTIIRQTLGGNSSENKIFNIFQGYGFLEMDLSTDMLNVTLGDIIGYESTGGLLKNDVYTNPQTGLSQGSHALLRAITSQPSVSEFCHTYSALATYNITTNVSNVNIDAPQDKSQATVIIAQSINNTILVLNTFSATGEIVHITLDPHTGSDLSYFWDYGNGMNATTTTYPVNYTYHTSGTYTLTVNVSNALENKHNATLIIVEDRLGSINMSVVSKALEGVPLSILVNISQGSDYVCNWNITDGTASMNFNEYEMPTGGFIKNHTFAYGGLHNITLTCKNNISESSYTLPVPIVETISGIKLTTVGAITSTDFRLNFTYETGSFITWELIYDSSPFPDSSISHDESSRNCTVLHTFNEAAPGLHSVRIRGTNPIGVTEKVFNFTVEAPILNAALEVMPHLIRTHTSITAKLTMDSGSSLLTLWNYQDGTSTDSFNLPMQQDWNLPSGKTFSHLYTTGGDYTVNVTIKNSIEEQTVTDNVSVINDVKHMEFTNEGLIGIDMFGKGYADFTIGQASTPPEGPFNYYQCTVDITFGDGSRVTNQMLTATSRFTHVYKGQGVYRVTAIIGNPYSNQTINQDISVVDSIIDVKLTVQPNHAILGNEVSLGVSMYKGLNATIFYDFGGNSTTIYAERQATTPDGQDIQKHTYARIGEYVITVRVNNAVGNISLSYLIAVQEQVLTNFSLSSTAPQSFVVSPIVNVTLTYPGYLPLPTDASLEWNWSDGQLEKAEPLGFTTPPYTRTFSHSYKEPGVYRAIINIYNLASNYTFEVDTGVYIDITEMNVTVMFIPTLPLNSPLQSGLIDGRTFPNNVDIFMNVNNTGTAKEYTVFSESPNWMYICCTSENPARFTVTKSGNYSVLVKASNPLGSLNTTVDIRIVEAIRDVTLTDLQPGVPVKPGSPKAFNVSLLSADPQSCLIIDHGDKSTVEYYGDDGTCLTTTKGPLPNVSHQLLISHIYSIRGTFVLNATGYNAISKEMAMSTFTISEYDCAEPDISIENRHGDFANPKKAQKMNPVQITGTIDRINCAVTLDNTRLWTIEYVGENSGNVIREYEGSHRISSRDKTELIIPGQTLSYGVYKMTFTVTMAADKFPDGVIIKSQVYTYVKVIPSDLQIIMVQGGLTRTTRGFGENLVLDPAKYSFDPDIPRDIDQGFTNYIWYCKRLGEDFPLNKDGTRSAENKTSPYTLHELNATVITDRGGCFRKGPGAISYTGQGRITINTLTMLENTAFEFLVDVYKSGEEGDRMNTAVLIVDLVPGSPPVVGISCANRALCQQRQRGQVIIPSNRLALIGSCESGCTIVDMMYKWTMRRLNKYKYWVDVDDLDSHVEAISATASKSIAIQPSLFEKYADSSEFEMKLESSRIGYTIPGVGKLKLYVNTPPMKGNCSILSPKVMFVLNDEFHFHCQAWEDIPDDIKGYAFYALFRDDQVEKMLYAGEKRTVKVKPIVGPDYDNYTMELYVRIYDNLNSFTTRKIGTVQVFESPLSDVSSVVEAKKAILASGSLDKTSQVITQISSSLRGNALVKSGGYGITGSKLDNNTIPVTSSRDREEKAKTMSTLVNSMVGLSILADKQAMLITSSTMAVASTVQIALPRNAQLIIASLTSSLANRIATSLTASITREELVRLAGPLISTIGLNLETTQAHILDPTMFDLDAAKEKAFYDTDLETTDLKLGDLNPSNAEAALYKETNTRLQTTAGKEVTNKLFGALNDITGSIGKNLIVGEKPVRLTTTKMALHVEKNNVQQATNKTFEMPGGSTVTLPTACKLLPDNCTSENVITVSVASAPYNVFGLAKDAHLISKDSSTVIVDIRDNQGDIISVQNTKEEIKIMIPRNKNVNASNSTTIINKPEWKKTDMMAYHKLNVTNKGASLHLEIRPHNPNIQFLVVVRFDGFPDPHSRIWDHMQMIPTNMSLSRTNITKEESTQLHTIFLDNNKLNNTVGNIRVGIRQLEPNETDHYVEGNRPPPAQIGWGNITTGYSIKMFTSGCYHIRSDTGEWSSEGCRVGTNTNTERTECFCNHLTAFAGGWVVVPNSIDWNYVFSNSDFLKNPTIYITEIVIGVVYILSAIWSRRRERKDKTEVGVAPLPDNKEHDKYLYEIVVFTGMRKNSGTDSNVQFILSGENDETEVRTLKDDKRKILTRGGINRFLMAVPGPLGQLQYARIWHDNSGKGKFASWYLKYFLIRDIQTKERFYFICNRWFAVEEDDGQVDRLIPVAGDEQMVEFAHLFTMKTQKKLSDEHLWFSIIAQPPQSRFTRFQRVSCCLMLLYLTMLANAMFYEQVPDSSSNGALKFGPFYLTPEQFKETNQGRVVWFIQISVGVMSNLVVFPVSFVVVWLFRKSRPKNKRPSRIQAALKKLDTREGTTNTGSGERTQEKTRPGSSLSSHYRALDNMSSSKTVSPSSSIKSSKPRKEKKKCELPWWGSIIAWILLWLSVAASVAMVTFYGISFGDLKAQKWITSMIISFFMSIFITQPIKVFCMAIIFSLIFKKTEDEEDAEDEEDEEEPDIEVDEAWLHPQPDLGYGAAKPRKIAYRPPDASQLAKARDYRIKELKMYDILREITFYCMFLWILMVISYSQRDPNAYWNKLNVDNHFTNPGDLWVDMRKMSNHDKFWNWTLEALVPGLRADKWYNGDFPIGLRGYLKDRTNRIMGFATLRQLRVPRGKCQIEDILKNVINECNIPYSIFDEDTARYGVGWVPYNISNNRPDEYKYQSSSSLEGAPFLGPMNTLYGGGGYVFEMRGSLNALRQKTETLMAGGWVDRYTRAVFAEFTSYNPGVNLFTVATMLIEFPETGGILPSFRFESIRLLSHYGSAIVFQLVCEITYLLFILFFLIKESRKFWTERLSYFRSFWNCIEFFIIVFSVFGTVIYFYRLITVQELTNRFKVSHGNKYMKFQQVAYWDEMLTYLIGTVVFLASLKFLRLLRFNRRMSLLASTLQYSAKSLSYFSIVFFTIFFAFVQFFYLVLFNQLRDWATFIYSAESCLQIILGKFDFNAMKTVSPIIPIIFFLFVVCNTFILINMFLSIIGEGFTNVKADIAKQSNEYEMVDFMINRFKMWTGFGTVDPAKSEPESDINHTISDKDDEEYVSFSIKMERLLNSISKVYFDADRMESVSYQEACKVLMKDTNLKSQLSHSSKYVSQPKRKYNFKRY